MSEITTNRSNEIFKEAAKLCYLREALIGRIKILNHEIEDHFLSDDEYIRQNSEISEAKIWIWVIIIIVVLFVSSVFVRTRQAAQTAGIVAIPVSIIVYWAIRKACKTKKKLAAKKELTNYHEEHQKFLEIKEQKEKELAILNHDLEEIVRVLRDTQQQGIPEEYWDVGYVLWHYVVIGRAENRREAMRIYDEDLRHKQLLNKLNQLDDIKREIRQVQIQQAETAQRMEYLALRNEINNNINTMMTILAIRNT